MFNILKRNNFEKTLSKLLSKIKTFIIEIKTTNHQKFSAQKNKFYKQYK